MRNLGAEKYDVEIISSLVANFEIGEFHSQQRTGMVVITIVLFLNSDIYGAKILWEPERMDRQLDH